MSYNSQVETFVVGDLVYFTGYEIENPPIAHKIGIVTQVGQGSKLYRLYKVFWIHSKSFASVNAKHLVLAYTKES
jgi:hypothetical protein